MRDMVAIIGSGMMGSGIGAMAALAGKKTGRKWTGTSD